MAYFQAYSNTYASVGRLREIYVEALSVKDIVGLIVATRPDCLENEVLDFLQELHQQTYLWLEIGMQSAHDRSLLFMNRRHNHDCTVSAIERAKERALRVCAHVILGMPGETRADMLATAKELNHLGVDGVKLHLLHVMKDTELAELYESGKVGLLDRDTYAGLVCDFLEQLNPAMIIHRLTGDGGRDNLIAPLWSLNKFEVLNLIDATLLSRGTKQGSSFQANL